MSIVLKLQSYNNQALSTSVLLDLLKDYKRPYDKIDELVNHGYLKQLRRGLYKTSELISPTGPEPFLISNHIYGPSYVSLESALFYWGLIPERPFTITSCTTKRSKEISAAQIHYSFSNLPISYYPLGIQTLELAPKQSVLIAGPEKSLCDKIVTTAGINLRSKKQAIEFLTEDLRIEIEELLKLDLDEMNNWLPACPKKNSIETILKAISNL